MQRPCGGSATHQQVGVKDSKLHILDLLDLQGCQQPSLSIELHDMAAAHHLSTLQHDCGLPARWSRRTDPSSALLVPVRVFLPGRGLVWRPALSCRKQVCNHHSKPILPCRTQNCDIRDFHQGRAVLTGLYRTVSVSALSKSRMLDSGKFLGLHGPKPWRD